MDLGCLCAPFLLKILTYVTPKGNESHHLQYCQKSMLSGQTPKSLASIISAQYVVKGAQDDACLWRVLNISCLPPPWLAVGRPGLLLPAQRSHRCSRRQGGLHWLKLASD